MNNRNGGRGRSEGLKRLREDSGRTQAQLAAEVGYSTSHYAMVEREPRLLRRALAEKLAKALQVGLDDLLRHAAHDPSVPLRPLEEHP